MRHKLVYLALAAGLAVLCQAMPAHAQATRTWVSGVGDDVNPCSRTAPCKTFAGAISKTAAGGQISVLDPAGFGAVTITKSISIVAEGAEGGVLASQTNGVTVNVGPRDVVMLRGLIIEGAGNGLNGIRMIAGGDLHVEDSVIRGFQAGSAGVGVSIESSADSRVFISNTAISKNLRGIVVKPAAGAAVFLDRVQAIENANAGITADGAKAVVRLNQSTVAANGTGLTALNGGQILSFGNNAIAGNTQDGAPTVAVPLR